MDSMAKSGGTADGECSFGQIEAVCGGEAESAAVKMEQASLFDSALMSLLGMIL